MTNKIANCTGLYMNFQDSVLIRPFKISTKKSNFVTKNFINLECLQNKYRN